MAQSTMLHVRVDEEVKTQASEALAAMGLSVSDAVRILLKRVVDDVVIWSEPFTDAQVRSLHDVAVNATLRYAAGAKTRTGCSTPLSSCAPRSR